MLYLHLYHSDLLTLPYGFSGGRPLKLFRILGTSNFSRKMLCIICIHTYTHTHTHTHMCIRQFPLENNPVSHDLMCHLVLSLVYIFECFLGFECNHSIQLNIITQASCYFSDCNYTMHFNIFISNSLHIYVEFAQQFFNVYFSI